MIVARKVSKHGRLQREQRGQLPDVGSFLITLMNPKAIVFYMAFFPLFIDPATHRGGLTFGVMAATIAALTAVYCLTLCALARVVATQVKTHRRLARWMERLAGVFLVGFGIRLAST